MPSTEGQHGPDSFKLPRSRHFEKVREYVHETWSALFPDKRIGEDPRQDANALRYMEKAQELEHDALPVSASPAELEAALYSLLD